MNLTLPELSLILRSVFKIYHSLPMLSIVSPLTYIHVTVRVFSEPIPLKTAINELSLVPDPSVLHKHPQAAVLTVPPLPLIVLSLVLPYVYPISVEVVLSKLPLEPMSSLLEHKHPESVHHCSL